jgi:HD-GYP domain-containing protein (c-di-GMP phosphodiesterase class II)
MSKLPWHHTIRFRIGLALFAIFTLQAGTAGYTLYAVDLRKHDYEILNLAGQMRVVSDNMAQQSHHFLSGGLAAGGRNEEAYLLGLQDSIKRYDLIITSFRNRRLDPELTGHDEPLVCNWDGQSRNQLDISAGKWDGFRAGLAKSNRLQANSLNAQSAALYVAARGDELVKSSGDLTRAFQHMMEGKLANLKRFNQIALAVSALLALLVVAQVVRKILRPMDSALAGFARVANGDLGYQIPLTARNEIGRMTEAFNHLSARMRALFAMTDKIGQGASLHEAIRFVGEEFDAFLPVEWVGVLILTPDRSQLALERLYSKSSSSLREGRRFPVLLHFSEEGLAQQRVIAEGNLAALASTLSEQSFIASLVQEGMNSAAMMPIGHGEYGYAVLVFASAQNQAYTVEHVEFLGNLKNQISHLLEKTLVMEGLVVAAVEGLAKLAESRDPETGDHLVRMSLYSVILAETLAEHENFMEEISPAYVRDIFRFAPMHDIGKVGISDDILLKPGRLTPEERTDMEQHPVIGGQVLRRSEEQMKRLGHSIFQIGIEIAECHHEKFDGSGYPQGLRGKDIPLSARIIAVADVFDALTSRRPYKEAWPVEKALSVIQEDAGKHFDPSVVAALEQAWPRVMEIYGRLKHV